MYDYHIYSRLKKYAKEQKSFHMPGHKAHGDFKSKFPDATIDVTELSYSDNLHCPDGVIAAAQRDIAEILGAEKSYITTDGSSSGVYAMAYCASKRGNKIIVFRNSHQSVWNACKLFGLEPLVIQGKESDGVLQPSDSEIIEKLLSADANISGVLATSPDYYGNVAPLARYREITKKYNRLLLVDGAHGAHLTFGDKKKYAGTYADMWVDGAHKTLATLTQGAIVNVNKTELIEHAEEALSLFRTTSPSYPIMASVEFGVKYLANNPKIITRAKTAVEEFKKSESGFTVYPSADWTKLLIDFKPLGMSADKVLSQLEKKGVFAEFSDGRYILFYLSPMTDPAELNALKKKLGAVLENKKLKNTYKEKPSVPEGDRSYSFQYALRKNCEWVELDDAVGRMCAKNAGIAPPCIPVVVSGEMITLAAVKALSQAHTFGLKDGKICVVKKW
ncbi:MAG: aminotransferase class I/II-fold pyridoxal phosphate-dependent enzyme [Clostridia bacterium]|nr:aminotransferase class I/II-fold pyridoxal phosphate-dependent enzyme [Clostridia bacterium]